MGAVYFPRCAWTSLGSWVSFHLPLALWLKDVVDRERIALSSICSDGTNFYTFLDTLNTRCSLAVRGKTNKDATTSGR